MRHRASPSEQIKRHWFPICILIIIILASIFPNHGNKNMKHGCVCLIFFISGLTTTTSQFISTIENYKLHAFIQGFSWLVVPLGAQVLGLLGLLGTWARRGALAAACVPPAPAAALVLTQSATGNQSAAVINSILGSLLGIVLTPLLLLINLGWTTLVPLASTMLHLTLTVLLPVCLGQMFRQCPRLYQQLRLLPCKTLGQIALLILVFISSCETLQTRDFHLTAPEVLVTVLMVLLLQIALLGVSFIAAKSPYWEFSAQDTAAAVLCSTQKSLTLGLPILRVMFHGFSHLGQISLPLLVFHPTQILLGAFVAAALKPWIQQQQHQHQHMKKLPL